MTYEPKLPDGVTLPAGASLNTKHPDYVALEKLATEEGWTQKSFGRVLGLEASRSLARPATPAAPPPAPTPPTRKFSELSTSEQFHAALLKGQAPRRGS